MSIYTYQMVITNYEMLANEDPQVREKANIFLISLIDRNQVWIITRQLIMQNSLPNYQVLGSQILYQKIQRDVEELKSTQMQQLKQFFFLQLSQTHFNAPTIRKLAASLALVAIYSFLDSWPNLLNDIVKFMAGSHFCLQSGLILLTSISQELKKNNRLKMVQKMQIKSQLLAEQTLLTTVFIQTLQINNNISQLSLDCIENWINIGFPLLKKPNTIKIIIRMIEQKQDIFLQSCCKILSQTLKLTAQEKFQVMSSTIDLANQIKKYDENELSSLKLIVEHFGKYKANILAAMNIAQGLSDVEIYTLIIKQMLLSFGFLLLEDIGYQLIEIMINAMKSKSLKLSYSTFQFWLDFIQKLGKSKVEEVYQQKFMEIVDLTLNIVLQKIKVSETFLHEMLKDDDTIDDMEDISFNQYRKQAQYLIKNSYEFFILKKEKQGSTGFFRKLITSIQSDFPNKKLGIGAELSVFAIKSIQQSLIQPYDTQNLLDFIQYLMKSIELYPQLPPKLTASILQLIKNSNRQIRSRDNLFISSLSFTLKYVQTQDLCHYAVYAFQSLMESIQSISNPALINDLLTFYNSITFTKQMILQKILEGILTSITKLTDQQIIYKYLQIIMNGIISKNKNLLNSKSVSIQDHSLVLIEINIFLDSYDHIQEVNRERFNVFFVSIADQGILMITKIISSFITSGIKFTNVNQLGLSLSLCKNALKICSNLPVQNIPIDNYIHLMNLILTIFHQNNISIFLQFANLIQIINKILSEFMNKNIPQLNKWLLVNLQNISSFFFKYMEQRIKNVGSIDPDIMKYYFSMEQSVLIYNKQMFMGQAKILDIVNLALFCIKYLNEKQMQRRIISFLNLAIQHYLFSQSYQNIFKHLFSSIPIINNICYINIAKIFISILDKFDLKNKENICRQLLQSEPYLQVGNDLKQILAKFMAFAIDSKVQRYLKGVLSDICQIQKKQVNKDMALHLQMRFSNWKRQFKKNSNNKLNQMQIDPTTLE